jgi:flagellar export protein FliJ
MSNVRKQVEWLLRLSRQEESAARQAVAEVFGAVRTIEESLLKLRRSQIEHHEAMRRILEVGVASGDLRLHGAAAAELAPAIQEARAKLVVAARILHQRREELAQAMKRRQSAEALAERIDARRGRLAEKAITREMDELFATTSSSVDGEWK